MDEPSLLAFAPDLQVYVTANTPPTLSSFIAPVASGDEDSEITVTFGDLAAQGDENDADGTVDAFVVKAVTSGTLRIGADAGSAAAWAAGLNDTLNATTHAYWTPDPHANGTLGAFEVVAQDDDGAESAMPVAVQVTVNPINDAPTIAVTGAATVKEGELYTLNLLASDPDVGTIIEWTIDWGDGTIETFAGNPSSVTHTYSNAGFTNNIVVSATDEYGTYILGDMLVASNGDNSVFRFDATSVGFENEFADANGLVGPVDIEIGPDGLLYVTGFGSNDLHRYDPASGAFVECSSWQPAGTYGVRPGWQSLPDVF